MKRHNQKTSWGLEALENRQMLTADFTLVAMSDSQYTVESFPAILPAQTAWAAGAAADPAQNVAFLAVQGDMLRRGYSTDQATVAKNALDLLNGTVAYTTSIGNHDYDNQFDDLDHHISSANYESYFGDGMFAREGAASGFIGSSLDQRNRAQIVTMGDRQYMMLSIEWEAPDSAIAWAQSMINANPNVPVILSTHEYLNGSGRTTSPLDPAGNSGNGIFTKLVYPNSQIFLVLSGHTGAVRQQSSTNSAGSVVYETCSDFEGQPNGGNGYLQLFHFYPDQNKISVYTYSPYLDTPESPHPATWAYDLPLDFSTRFNFNNTAVPIDTNTTAPVANADSAATDEGESVTINPVANDTDADGDAVTAILSSLPAHGAVFVNSNGTFTYTPDPKFVGLDTFQYYPVDAKVRGAETTVTVTVADTNAAYSYPVGETTSGGTRTGSYLDLAASGDTVENLTGGVSQEWQFNVTAGTEITFCVNAWRDWNTNEYKFQYRTGSTWYDMTQIVPASSKSVTRTDFSADEPYQMWRLPASTAGTIYVRPVSTDSQSGGWSITADEMFVMTTGVVVVQPPAAPTLLSGTYNSKKRQETLKWRDNATNETGYHVWYSTDNGQTWLLYTTLSANSTNFTTSALTKGRTYQFKVSAFNSAGESLFSNIVSVLA